jgi:hypothetical protein
MHPIREYRHRYGLTQVELAEQWTSVRGWPVHQCQISHWEVGIKRWSRQTQASWRRFVDAQLLARLGGLL